MRAQVAGILFACVFDSRRHNEQVYSAHRMVCSSCRGREWLRGANAGRDTATNGNRGSADRDTGTTHRHAFVDAADRDPSATHGDCYTRAADRNTYPNAATHRDASSANGNTCANAHAARGARRRLCKGT